LSLLLLLLLLLLYAVVYKLKNALLPIVCILRNFFFELPPYTNPCGIRPQDQKAP
jgi:hypothetical protein